MDYTWRKWGLLSFLHLESALPVCLTLTQWRCLLDYTLTTATHRCRCSSFGRSIADNADLLTFTAVSYHHKNRRITDWKYGQCGLNRNSAKFAQETVDSEIRHDTVINRGVYRWRSEAYRTRFRVVVHAVDEFCIPSLLLILLENHSQKLYLCDLKKNSSELHITR